MEHILSRPGQLRTGLLGQTMRTGFTQRRDGHVEGVQQVSGPDDGVPEQRAEGPTDTAGFVQ